MSQPWMKFYPRDWRGSRWITFDPGASQSLPRAPACYVIYLNGQISYVGQTVDFKARMRGHKIEYARYSSVYWSAWGTFRDIKVKARFGTKFGDWASRELRLISRLQPPLNSVGVSRIGRVA